METPHRKFGPTFPADERYPPNTGHRSAEQLVRKDAQRRGAWVLHEARRVHDPNSQ
ncbi:MAG: hypothetical protein ACRDST_08040 [Pseudonocardiaceae bacterium]